MMVISFSFYYVFYVLSLIKMKTSIFSNTERTESAQVKNRYFGCCKNQFQSSVHLKVSTTQLLECQMELKNNQVLILSALN